MMEIYSRHNYSLLKASLVVETSVGLKLLTPCFRNKNVVLCLLDANTLLLLVMCFLGLQLGYTVVFGSYASFLFIRTGNIVAPLVAHAFCNYMGLPVLFVHGKGPVSIAFVAGMVSFVWLLFPITQPDLYNENTNNCRCWQGYCSWNQ
ncbi:hypothetical protein Gorai_013536 [Gossypium raimondii]|uniref:intramembrane prenyl-peptidase Rce1 n=1 Tax=Gossypium raimondii TaxID=29730 RepID=A0A7J8Q5D6_GOSRA|nr:hypothetical protein [Gossypium raimondii]